MGAHTTRRRGAQCLRTARLSAPNTAGSARLGGSSRARLSVAVTAGRAAVPGLSGARSRIRARLAAARGLRCRLGAVGAGLTCEASCLDRDDRMSQNRAIRRVIIRGRVQGVGFRAWTEHEARRRALDGWVRNRRDGAVEAVFAGPAAGGSLRAGDPGLWRPREDLCGLDGWLPQLRSRRERRDQLLEYRHRLPARGDHLLGAAGEVGVVPARSGSPDRARWARTCASMSSVTQTQIMSDMPPR